MCGAVGCAQRPWSPVEQRSGTLVTQWVLHGTAGVRPCNLDPRSCHSYSLLQLTPTKAERYRAINPVGAATEPSHVQIRFSQNEKYLLSDPYPPQNCI